MDEQIVPHRLVWLDLEMTGLDPETDVILEIATVVTDLNLEVLAIGPELVIHQPESVLSAMGTWCQEHHGRSGLTDDVRVSKTTLAQAESQTLAFLESWVAPGTSPLCGNTVSQDRRFLLRYMPTLQAFFHYRHWDVSTFKLAAQCWSPQWLYAKSDSNHRALQDVLASIDEGRHYQKLWQAGVEAS